jgi:hypothetical protein
MPYSARCGPQKELSRQNNVFSILYRSGLLISEGANTLANPIASMYRQAMGM